MEGITAAMVALGQATGSERLCLAKEGFGAHKVEGSDGASILFVFPPPPGVLSVFLSIFSLACRFRSAFRFSILSSSFMLG